MFCTLCHKLDSSIWNYFHEFNFIVVQFLEFFLMLSKNCLICMPHCPENHWIGNLTLYVIDDLMMKTFLFSCRVCPYLVFIFIGNPLRIHLFLFSCYSICVLCVKCLDLNICWSLLSNSIAFSFTRWMTNPLDLISQVLLQSYWSLRENDMLSSCNSEDLPTTEQYSKLEL